MNRPLEINDILLTRYRVIEVLEMRSSFVLYKVRDLNFVDVERYVAVKERWYGGPDATLRAQYLKSANSEAMILAMLSHPAIPKVYDFFGIEDRVFMVMEYIEGQSLGQILNLNLKLKLDRILQWGIELARALHFLHTQMAEPIIHRAITPSNIMIDVHGNIRLYDFSLSTLFAPNLTKTNVIEQGYAPPEQYESKPTPQSDTYGLGATLHHILTGKDPRLAAPFSFGRYPVSQFREDANSDVDLVINTALAYEVEDRYQNAQEVLSDLEDLRAGNRPGIAYSALLESTKVLAPEAIFISYKREDWDEFVRPLITKLQNAGLQVWVDQHDLEGGEDWLDEINEALRVCNRMILCVSPEALLSRHVKLEYRYFFNRDKKMYPLICRPTEMPAELDIIQHYPYAEVDALVSLLKQAT